MFKFEYFVFQCPNKTEIADFVKAVQDGIITWHAGPMNMQIENMDNMLLNVGLGISQQLDNWFKIKRKTRILSQRDVPGMLLSNIMDIFLPKVIIYVLFINLLNFKTC